MFFTLSYTPLVTIPDSWGNSKLGLFRPPEEIVFLTAVNAVIAALAAMGACDLTLAKAGK